MAEDELYVITQLYLTNPTKAHSERATGTQPHICQSEALTTYIMYINEKLNILHLHEVYYDNL